MGCGAVLMKGGHLDDAESPDWLFTRDGEVRFTAPRVQTKNTHGTGCTLSAALAALRPRHDSWADTVQKPKPGSLRRWQKPILWKWVTVLGRFIIFMHGGKPYTGRNTTPEKTEMEQAHTRLIAQLNERIAAPDNTPLYLKFAETVKNAVRSGVLEHGNILPGERDLSQLTGVSRITVRKAMQALEEEGVVTRARGYGTQINNIFEYSLKEARGFSQQVVLTREKAQYAVGQQTRGEVPGRGGQPAVTCAAKRCLCLSAFVTWMTMRCRLKSPGFRWD
jgi:DNA-binding transcriptional regulator YhcF (GntR family)